VIQTEDRGKGGLKDSDICNPMWIFWRDYRGKIAQEGERRYQTH
jgi:hypothetical protein